MENSVRGRLFALCSGAITQVPGTAAHIEQFSIECTVTAHQTSTATFEAKVRIAMDWFAYGVPLLLFPGSNSFPASKAPGTWKDFAVRCAPNTAWLQVSSIGTLTKSGSIGTGGVMTEDASKAGQTGGVCVVSALHLPTGGKWQLRQAKVMAVWPQPWSSMSYQASSVSVTLGEQLPILKLPVGSPGTLKPSDFFVACDTTPSLKWSYDSLLSTGLLEGASRGRFRSEVQVNLWTFKNCMRIFMIFKYVQYIIIFMILVIFHDIGI